ncbi:MAG: hemerythrin domain-containing protein [Elusimicrobia bacterium]|nr:hemerythrin domain-containing protein [Elusimicrobiota bacterium]MBK7544289.1 hemerythrin domain-containing protein [Elusimicrobiota bacterium]MBK7573811.1 hemerythrin domain-containing protein [Elusimicrobiota bacterium]MBK7689409.1 hemerythrin domain-containing protein [Elusimicrobiota bacterium]MBK8125955.1 hemerythrin domain-containing protein [Elusimicrobiota bacterium]
MATATGELLKDHKMIRKLLGDLRVDNPRVAEIAATLQRVTLAHAWFEDEFLMPLLKGSPLIPELFWQEITQEHNDIARLLELLRGTPPDPREEWEVRVLSLRTILETHFTKEEAALFPLAEKVIGVQGLTDLAAGMERRKSEVRPS